MYSAQDLSVRVFAMAFKILFAYWFENDKVFLRTNKRFLAITLQERDNI